MQAEARAAAEDLGLDHTAGSERCRSPCAPADGVKGLLLEELVDRRWKVAPRTAAAKLLAAGLPVEHRSARLIYSWPSIFRAEGMSAAQAALVTREADPGLFEDLLDGRAAARLLGVGSDSTIRRKVLSGAIPSQACVVFGSRGMRRFRPAFLEEERRLRLRGRLV